MPAVRRIALSYSRVMRWIAAAWLVVAACGSPAPTCKDAIARSAKTLETSDGDAATLVDMCEQQHWSDDLRRCVARASSQQEAGMCVADKLAADPDVGGVDTQGVAIQQVKAATADLEQLAPKVHAATDAVMNATTDADRAAATATLHALQRQKEADQKRIEAYKRLVNQAERALHGQISPECLNNPLANGCN